MSLRSTFALLLGVVLLTGCGALFFWNPTVAAIASAFMVAGALVARFASGGEGAGVVPDASTASLSTSRRAPISNAHASPETTANSGVADDVPASTLLEATMESMREGVVVIDGTTRVLASNRSAREIFGDGEDDLLSRRLSELTRNPSIHAAFAAALERGERAEVKVETMDAERRVFDLRVAPLGRGRDTTRGAIGVFFNITRLERLERVRQEFLSNVSHELRTPLTAIITFVESLEDGAIDDAANNRRFLSVIRRNAARMHNLIDDILELSAIEAGTAAVEASAVHLHTLVGDVFTSLASRAAERNVELRNEVSPEATVYADARRLEQMITNLADNAVKFNREGGTVVISHEPRERADRINVTDTGEGIAPEYIARIFERFYRVDRARSLALGGTGLGLAIVKHLARAHGGEATVRSTYGQGSTFTIELPSAPPAHDSNI
ncbi:MAG TPA: ATP-binding protein [Pyrinomonadaceae bacterium]|jgi:two-component system phosphate regulon sensor histidine kinase PhoR